MLTRSHQEAKSRDLNVAFHCFAQTKSIYCRTSPTMANMETEKSCCFGEVAVMRRYWFNMTVFLGSEYNLLIVRSSTSHKGNPIIKTLIYRAKIRSKKKIYKWFFESKRLHDQTSKARNIGYKFCRQFLLTVALLNGTQSKRLPRSSARRTDQIT